MTLIELPAIVLVEQIEQRKTTFIDVLNTYKNATSRDNFFQGSSALTKLLHDRDFFGQLIKKDLLTLEDLKHLLSSVQFTVDIVSFTVQSSLYSKSMLQHIIENKMFVEFVDSCERIKQTNMSDDIHSTDTHLRYISSDAFLSCMHMLTAYEIQYLLDKLNTQFEYMGILTEPKFLKHLLSNFLLSDDLVNRYAQHFMSLDWFQSRNIHSLFDSLEKTIEEAATLYPFDQKRGFDQELLDVVNMNRKLFENFSSEQREALFDKIQNQCEVADKLKYVLMNDLYSTFENFDDLIRYFDKKDKKLALSV